MQILPPAPGEMSIQDIFLNYAVSLYEQAKSMGTSTEGALTLVSQIALESAFATGTGVTAHKNPYSLKPNGKLMTFTDYVSAASTFFKNLDKNWPTEMTALASDDISADALDKAYHTEDYEILGGLICKKINRMIMTMEKKY